MHRLKPKDSTTSKHTFIFQQAKSTSKRPNANHKKILYRAPLIQKNNHLVADFSIKKESLDAESWFQK